MLGSVLVARVVLVVLGVRFPIPRLYRMQIYAQRVWFLVACGGRDGAWLGVFTDWRSGSG